MLPDQADPAADAVGIADDVNTVDLGAPAVGSQQGGEDPDCVVFPVVLAECVGENRSSQ